MTENLTLNSAANIVPDRSNDLSILLIGQDTESVASLTSILQQFSYKVMNVNKASEAISMIETEKDIGLVIANTEMPHIDSHSLLTALHQKDISLILISSETETTEASDLLMKRACFCLKKPVSEKDIKNMWEHVKAEKSQESEKINLTEKHDDVIEAFRKSIKKQKLSQASMLGRRRRPMMQVFKTPETYQKRRDMANAEPKKKSILSPNEAENKAEDAKKVDVHPGRKCNVWSEERHTKFLAAISILGDEKSRPKAILKVINDPNLTHRQVGSHLQKYKTMVDKLSDAISMNDGCEPRTDYEYPLKTSNIVEDLISFNSLWFSLKKKKKSTSFIHRYSFKKPDGSKSVKVPPKSQLVPNNAPEEVSHVPLVATSNNPPSNIPPTDDNLHHHIGMVSTVPLPTSNNPPSNIPSTNDLNHTGVVSTLPSPTSNNPLYYIPSTNDLNHTGVVSTLPSPTSNNPPYYIPSTNDLNHTGVVSTGLNSSTLHAYSSVPSNSGGFHMGSAMNFNPQYDANPFQSLSSIVEPDRNPIGIEPNTYVPQTMGGNYQFPIDPFGTNVDQMEWIPSAQNYSHQETNMNCMDWIPSTENHYLPQNDMNMVVPEAHTNLQGWVSSGEGYVPTENMVHWESNINPMDGFNFAFPQNMTSHETNTNQMGFVYGQVDNPIRYESSNRQMNWGLDEEGYGKQTDMFPCETSHVHVVDTVPPEANTEDTSLFPFADIPIEDLISFDADVNEMDMPSWLQNYDFSLPSLTSNLGHDSVPSAPFIPNQHATMEAMNQRDGINVDELEECMDWIDQMLSNDA